jgi:hypothetical protein
MMSQQPVRQHFQLQNGDGQLSAQVCMDTAFQGGSSLRITGDRDHLKKQCRHISALPTAHID